MPRCTAALLGLTLALAGSPAAAQGQVDLSLSGVFLASAQTTQGGTFTLNGSVQASGSFTGVVTLAVELGSGLGVVHTFSVALSGAALTPFTTTAVMPASAPVQSYLVSVVVDSSQQVPESNEGNNRINVPQLLQVVVADLDATAFTGAPTALLRQPYPVDLTITNVGQATASGFRFRIYLGSASGTILVDSGPYTLAVGQSLTLQESLTLPSTAGPYTLTLTVNDTLAVPESRLNNNLRRLDVLVEAPLPDLTATVAPFNGFAELGQTLRLSASLQNVGAVPTGTVSYSYYLSVDPTLTVRDRALATFTTQGPLPVGGFLSVQDDVQIPTDLSPSNYWLGVIVDPQDQIPEVNETNNASPSALLQVVAPDLLIVNEALPDGVVGVAYQAQLFAQGGAFTPSWSITQGGLPQGLALASTGELFGRPARAEVATFTVRATSGASTAERTFTLRVTEPNAGLSLSDVLPPAFVGQPYSTPLQVSGGVAPYAFALGRGPAWVALSAEGRLTGLPDSVGTFELLVEVSDSASHQLQAGLILEVRDSGTGLLISQASLPDGVVGQEYCGAGLVRLEAEGGQPPLTWSAESPPAPGLTLNPDGALCGTPIQVGAFSFVARVEDAAGQVDSALLSLEILAPGTLTITPSSLPGAQLGQPYQVALTASGGQAPYAFALGEGALPSGLALASDGALTGTPTQQGTFAFALTVQDAVGAARTLPYSIRVSPGIGLSDAEDSGCGCTTRTDEAGRSGPMTGLWALLAGVLWRARRRR
jgi:MYXO-CTERM domain-containing protein